MSGRELVILLLGLAIVAVVLRGLYVALNARRGQIKLAIDKNIPQNVDLEALEMAELPGGGARVVTRSLEEVNRQNSALDKAESKARRMHLADEADDEHIPVLMDAVELTEPAAQSEPEAPTPPHDDIATAVSHPEPVDEAGFAAPQMPLPEDLPDELEEIDEEEFSAPADQTPSIGEDWEEPEWEEQAVAEEEEFVAEQAEVKRVEQPGYSPELGVEDEDPDDVLFDYDDDDEDGSGEAARNSEDAMRAVAPDYEDVQDTDEDYEESEAVAEMPDDASYADEYLNEDADADSEDGGLDDEQDPAPFDADREVDEFSMTAGERIGGNPKTTGEARQSSLFDEHDDDVPETDSKPKKSRSLFGMFGRKSQRQEEAADLADEPQEQYAVDESPIEDDALAAETDWAEEDAVAPTARAAQPAKPEPEFVDELDQKRAASAEQDTESGRAQSEEFEQSEVLVLNVTAKDGRVFAGDDLLHILITSGLKFGDMNIFHKRLNRDNQGSVIFSVANMLNPGTFDLNNMDEFTTLGISFFLALPTPINNLDAFEQMLSVAQDIRDTLGGDLKDDHRNGMTAQTVEHYRQRIRDFELRRLKAVAARG